MDKKELAAALSKRLAGRKVSDALVNRVTDDILATGQLPIDIDICQFGLCVDYLVDRPKLGDLIEKFTAIREIGGIKVFPKGIINPDRFLVTVERAAER